MLMRTGGGTWTLNVHKRSTKVDIIGEGIPLFREGILRRGNEDDFEYEVLDYAEFSMSDDITVRGVPRCGSRDQTQMHITTKLNCIYTSEDSLIK